MSFHSTATSSAPRSKLTFFEELQRVMSQPDEDFDEDDEQTVSPISDAPVTSWAWAWPPPTPAMPKAPVLIRRFQNISWTPVSQIKIPGTSTAVTSVMPFSTMGPNSEFTSLVLSKDWALYNLTDKDRRYVLGQVQQYAVSNGSFEGVLTVLEKTYKDNEKFRGDASIIKQSMTFAQLGWLDEDFKYGPLPMVHDTTFKMTVKSAMGAPYFNAKKGDTIQVYSKDWKLSKDTHPTVSVAAKEMQIFWDKISTRGGANTLFSDLMFAARSCLILKSKTQIMKKEQILLKARLYGVTPLGAAMAFSLLNAFITDRFLKFPQSPYAIGFSYANGGGDVVINFIYSTERNKLKYFYYSDDGILSIRLNDDRIAILGPDVAHMDGSVLLSLVEQYAGNVMSSLGEGTATQWLSTAAVWPLMAVRSTMVFANAMAFTKKRGFVSGIPGTSTFDCYASGRALKHFETLLNTKFPTIEEKDLVDVTALLQTAYADLGFKVKPETLEWEILPSKMSDCDLMKTPFLSCSLQRIEGHYVPIRLGEKKDILIASLFFNIRHMKDRNDRAINIAQAAVGRAMCHYPDEQTHNIAQAIFDRAKVMVNDIPLPDSYGDDIELDLDHPSVAHLMNTITEDGKLKRFPSRQEIFALYAGLDYKEETEQGDSSGDENPLWDMLSGIVATNTQPLRIEKLIPDDPNKQFVYNVPPDPQEMKDEKYQEWLKKKRQNRPKRVNKVVDDSHPERPTRKRLNHLDRFKDKSTGKYRLYKPKDPSNIDEELVRELKQGVPEEYTKAMKKFYQSEIALIDKLLDDGDLSTKEETDLMKKQYELEVLLTELEQRRIERKRVGEDLVEKAL